jgi:hypothetical protein
LFWRSVILNSCLEFLPICLSYVLFLARFCLIFCFFCSIRLLLLVLFKTLLHNFSCLNLFIKKCVRLYFFFGFFSSFFHFLPLLIFWDKILSYFSFFSFSLIFILLIVIRLLFCFILLHRCEILHILTNFQFHFLLLFLEFLLLFLRFFFLFIFQSDFLIYFIFSLVCLKFFSRLLFLIFLLHYCCIKFIAYLLFFLIFLVIRFLFCS